MIFIKQLFNKSFKQEHFAAGSRASGLHPLSRSAIKDSQLTPSTAFSTPKNSSASTGIAVQQAPESQSQTSDDATIAEASVLAVVSQSCPTCGQDMTPMKLHVTAYLTKYIQPKQRQQKIAQGE